MKARSCCFLRGSWLAVIVGALFFVASPAFAQSKQSAVNVSQCYACHVQIQELHAGSKGHKSVNCIACHDGVANHLKDAMARPTTNVDPAACGSCHKDQFESLFTMDWHKGARKEKALYTGPAPSPSWDKIMAPHGFTKEHAEPRAHAFMVYDQFVADRAFGGRFQPKDGWKDYARDGGNFNTWDVLVDLYPNEPAQKAFAPGYAAAANPVCLSCKSMDHILDWAYMGDPQPGAKWSRTSNVVEMAKSINHAMNCYFCHDPHSAQPRVIRDALIQAVTRPEADTLYHKDTDLKNKANLTVKDMGMRGFTRKVAMMDKYDTKLQCGQCHVEYNCNPGTDTATGEPVAMKDGRTNYFPFVNVFDLGKNYNDIKFRDFKHKITGALLWKAQHPDVETYYGSAHQKAGVDCKDCHMPKVKNKAGKTFTSHWQTSPRMYLKETCLSSGCHKDWNEKQAEYVIDAMKSHYYGKLRHAEFWLTRLIDKIEEARNLGVNATLIKEAQEAQWEAGIHWEWWTATNGGYFHNQADAIKSINLGTDISQKMIDKLDSAMGEVRKPAPAKTAQAQPAPAAAPAVKK
jgi:formate-dependent nitrite reductase cytochrome c552 subunit